MAQQQVCLSNVLAIAYLDRLGMFRLGRPQLVQPPGADPNAGGVEGEPSLKTPASIPISKKVEG